MGNVDLIATYLIEETANIVYRLTSSVLSYKSFEMQTRAIGKLTYQLTRFPDNEYSRLARTWARYTLEACLNTRSNQSLVSEDASDAAIMLMLLEDPLKFLLAS